MVKQKVKESDYLKIAEGEDLADLMEHAGWVDVLEPRFRKAVNQLKDALVEATLQNSRGDHTKVSATELAARIYGLEWTMELIKKVILEGRDVQERISTYALEPLSSNE